MHFLSKHTEHFLNNSETLACLREIKRGFEKECLRVDEQGTLSEVPHPKALGASLTHPYITTDYSEALLEFITPPTSSVHSLFKTLQELHQFTYANLPQELLWVTSMPCNLPPDDRIPIAEYGHSNLAKLKYYYRMGLGNRYGRRMQTIAGIHYNFSFSLDFWKLYAKHQSSVNTTDRSLDTEQAFISEQYLGMIRNANRFAWILSFFFGSSPAACTSFLRETAEFKTLGQDTVYLPYATSLRLSDVGYHNKNKPIVTISHNSMSEYLDTITRAVHTKEPNFTAIGIKSGQDYLQLSDSVLQIEDEHYASFRPKRISAAEERMLSSLKREGIEYLEIRMLDLNPYLPMGVDLNTAHFLDIFLLYCLLKESPKTSDEENKRIVDNNQQVYRRGRDPHLELVDAQGETLAISSWIKSILFDMEPLAILLDKAYNSSTYSQAIKQAYEAVEDRSLLPSERMLNELKKSGQSFFDFALQQAFEHRLYFKQLPFTQAQSAYYTEIAEQSFTAVAQIKDTLSFDEFLKDFLVA